MNDILFSTDRNPILSFYNDGWIDTILLCKLWRDYLKHYYCCLIQPTRDTRSKIRCKIKFILAYMPLWELYTNCVICFYRTENKGLNMYPTKQDTSYQYNCYNIWSFAYLICLALPITTKKDNINNIVWRFSFRWQSSSYDFDFNVEIQCINNDCVMCDMYILFLHLWFLNVICLINLI